MYYLMFICVYSELKRDAPGRGLCGFLCCCCVGPYRGQVTVHLHAAQGLEKQDMTGAGTYTYTLHGHVHTCVDHLQDCMRWLKYTHVCTCVHVVNLCAICLELIFILFNSCIIPTKFFSSKF